MLVSLPLTLAFSPPNGAKETIVPLPGGHSLALSTRGGSALRVRFSAEADPAYESPMVAPSEPDAPFAAYKGTEGVGITASNIGSVVVSPSAELILLSRTGKEIMRSAPLASNVTDVCSALAGTDITGGTRAGDPQTVTDQAACCAACKRNADCKNWIFGDPGDAEGNCWLMSSISGTKASADRTLGGAGLGGGIRFSATSTSRLYGGGASKADAPSLTRSSVTPLVDNTRVFVPHYYSTDGYACLASTNVTGPAGPCTTACKTNVLPVSYNSDGSKYVSWSRPAHGSFELFLMPAPTLDEGTSAYFRLTGPPAVPPRYAFGFIASRWGWQNRSYIESVLHGFRDGRYPIDAFIGDFGWFTNVSDYPFPPEGYDWYHDFGYNSATFPAPAEQLGSYRKDLHFRMGGIRKPRLGNTALLDEARSKGFLLPGGERRRNRRLDEAAAAAAEAEVAAAAVPASEEEARRLGSGYADQRNLDFSGGAARAWYADHEAHYLKAGVSFFWNDEGETDYFTFHNWNVAQVATLRGVDPTRRFYSINRAWSPGMARLGATVWTGDYRMVKVAVLARP